MQSVFEKLLTVPSVSEQKTTRTKGEFSWNCYTGYHYPMSWGILLAYVLVSEKLNLCRKKGSWATESLFGELIAHKWHFPPRLIHGSGTMSILPDKMKGGNLTLQIQISHPTQVKFKIMPHSLEALCAKVFKCPGNREGGGGGTWCLAISQAITINPQSKVWVSLAGHAYINLFWVKPLPLSLSQLWLCLLFQCKPEAVSPREVCFLH